MEKLQRRSDGFAETPSGHLAISPLRSSGKNSEYKWFEFRRTAISEPIKVRWRIDDKIIVIEASTAIFMINKNYAKHATDEQIRSWNEMIDELDLDAPSPQPVPISEQEEVNVIQEGPEQPAEPPLDATAAEALVAPEEALETPEQPTEPPLLAPEPDAEPDAEVGSEEENDGVAEENDSDDPKPSRRRKAKEKTTEKGLL